MKRFLLATAMLVLGSCSAEDEPVDLPMSFNEACADVEGCMRPVVEVTGPPLAIWRVLVVREDGVSRIEAVQEVDVSSSVGVPQGPTHGVLGLAALDASDQPLELQLVRFPDEASFDYIDGTSESFFLDTVPVSFVGYLEVSEAASKLALVESDGTVVHSIDAPAPGEPVVLPEPEPGMSSGALVQAAPGSACGHVMLLEGVADGIWNDTNYTPLRPTPTQRAVIQAALGRLSPVHCMGLGRIVLVDNSEVQSDGSLKPTSKGGWVSLGQGDLMAINVALEVSDLRIDERALQGAHSRALLTGIVAHEAAHALTNLLSFLQEGDPFYQTDEVDGLWAPTERTLAQSTIDQARLRGDFLRLWSDMHESFVDLGWAESYCGSGEPPLACAGLTAATRIACNIANAAALEVQGLCSARLKPMSVEQISASGYMSHYSGISPAEDIADFAAWPVVGPLYEAAGVAVGPSIANRGFGCLAMREHGEPSVPSRLAAAYTKVTFLRDLGVLTEEDYQRCIGDSLGLPAEAPGFTVYEEGDVQNVFGNDPEGNIGTRDDRYVFVMEARGSADFGGEAQFAVLRLEVDLGPTVRNGVPVPVEQISWPRGAFRISPLTPHIFQLRLVDEPAGNFDVTDGFVLAAGATNDRIEGSVFVTQAFRYQAPIPVPQVFDPPLIFRFVLEN